jgi:hypothetical protein
MITKRVNEIENKIQTLGLEKTVLFVIAKNEKGDFDIPQGFDEKRGTVYVVDSCFQQLEEPNQKASKL